MEMDTEWSDYGFRWLFSADDTSTSYLPVEDQIKQYKTRDLEKSKVYIMAAKLWGLGARSRRRIITAPPMTDKPRLSMITTQANTLLQPRGSDGMQSSPRKASKKGDDWALSEKEQKVAHDEEVEERTMEYKHWYKDRVKLREGLESLGLSEKWLKRKDDLTPLEKRVCNKLETDRKAREDRRQSCFHWRTMSTTLGSRSGGPKINRPIPEGLVIIVQYLSRRRQRIVDLFAQADKDKNWEISRKEFAACIYEAGIPVSEELLNEAIDSLDTDGDDVVDYRELVAGVNEYKKMERTNAKFRQTSKATISVERPLPPAPRTAPTSTRMPAAETSPTHGPTNATAVPRSGSVMSDRTFTSSPATSTSSYLALPKTDVTETVELLPDDMVEKRKKEKHLSSQRTSRGRRKKTVGKIRTGNTAIDKHSFTSTLGGDVGKAVDKYRDARLKEYHQICKLCEKNGVPLTSELLQKAVLHPGDKPHRRIRKHIQQPGTQTISSHFANPPEPAESPSDFHNREKVVIGNSGELLMEAKHVYPERQDVFAEPELMNLSSGKAFVKSRVDCWMTFEQYDRLTRHLGKRYINVSDGGVDPNAFWPGQLLDKVRLYMPSGKIESSDCFFSTTKQRRPVNPGYTYNGMKWWPVSDTCYVKPADIEQCKKYTIDWK